MLFYSILAANIIAFTVYGYDKAKAIKNEARVPEKVLYLLCFLAPFGAYIAIKSLRHKTKKGAFIALCWVNMVLWIVFLIKENV